MECLRYSLTDLLLLVDAHELVDHQLGTDFLKLVINLLAVGVYPAGDDMDVGVVGVMVSINQQGLTGLAVAHLFKIAMGELHQLFMAVLVALAGDG